MPESPPSRRNHSPASRSVPGQVALATNSSEPSDNEGSEATAESMSSNSARGALSSGEGTSGDTLLPMLIAGLALIVLGVLAVFLIV